MSRQATDFEKRQILNSQEFRPDRSAQCKGIAACAYSLKNILTLMVCSIKTSFSLSFGQLVPNDPVQEGSIGQKTSFFSSFWKNGPVYPFRCLSSDARASACYVRALFDLIR